MQWQAASPFGKFSLGNSAFIRIMQLFYDGVSQMRLNQLTFCMQMKLLAIALAACSEQPSESGVGAKPNKSTFQEIPEWTGVFQDTLPCADCRGLITWLEIFPEGNYRRISTKIGFEDVFANTSSTEGKWKFDPGSGIIKLDVKIEKDRMAFIALGDSVLTACDEKGKILQGGRWKLRRRGAGGSDQFLKQTKPSKGA